MMRKAEDLIATPFDCRLGHVILDAAQDGGEVKTTHQEIAAELGSAREVISRKMAFCSDAEVAFN